MTDKVKTTVLLTGATGFVGSHLLRGLLESDYTVVIVKRSFSDTRRIEDLLSQVRAYDLDRVSLRQVFTDQQINVVIHTATCYGRKSENVSEIVAANVVFPVQLLELCHEFNTGMFLNTDTALPDGLNDYVLSKKHFLDYAQSLAGKSDMPFVNLRLEHSYGPHDDRTKFITFLIQSFLAHEAGVDLTAGKQLRDFIYVDDVVAAFLTLLEQRHELDTPFSTPFSTLGLGSGTTTSIEELVKMTHKLCAGATELRFGALDYRKGETMRSQADISKLQQLGWSPQVTLQEGLRRTVEAEKKVMNP